MDSKAGTDKDGRFVIHYGGREGIRWERGPAADAFFDAVASPPSSKLDVVTRAMNAASGVVGSVAAIAEAVGSLLQWWELRQSRLRHERRAETDQRLFFVDQLLDRWILEHSTRDHIDLKLSHYLAQECVGLLGHAGKKDGVLVPQALLYEIERVRQVVSAVRETVVRQFLAIQGGRVDSVASPVEGGAALRINYAALEPFFRSPEDEWNSAVTSKKVKDFEKELYQLSRNPHEIIAKVFDISAQQAQELNAALSTTAALLRSAVYGAAINVAKSPVMLAFGGFGAAGFLISKLLDRWTDEEIERKDAIRELVLFASEVERTSLLVRAWDVLDQTIRASRGGRLLVLEDSDGEPLIASLDDAGTYVRLEDQMLSRRLLPATVRTTASTTLVLPPGPAAGSDSAEIH